MTEHSVRITLDEPDTTAPMSAVKEPLTPMPIRQSRFEKQLENFECKLEELIGAVRTLQDSELVRKTVEQLNSKMAARSFWLQVLSMVGVVAMLGISYAQWAISQQIRSEAQAQVSRLRSP